MRRSLLVGLRVYGRTSHLAYVRQRTESPATEGNTINCEGLRQSDCAERQDARRQGVGQLHRWFSGSDEKGKQMKNMSKFDSYSGFLTWFMALLLVALVAGCGGGGGGGGRDPILGTGGNAVAAPTPPTPPTVIAVTPLNNANDVAINLVSVTAEFSEPMAPITGGATFTVKCTTTCATPPTTGAAVFDATNTIA